MIDLNYMEVPSSIEDDVNKDKTSWINGKCVSMDLGSAMCLYLGHRSKMVTEYPAEGEAPVERTLTEAFVVNVDKPATRDKCIAAAEMAAYGLSSVSDVASLNASLARKFRDNPEDPEVEEHDRFIQWVKIEFDKIGFKGDDSGDNVLLPMNHVYKFIRSIINKSSLSPVEALSVKGFYPEWKAGIDVKVGEYYRYEGRLYECDQQHTTQAGWKPGDQTALWHEVADGVSGTSDDPIHYNDDRSAGFEGMVLEIGKFYTQDGALYECVRDSVVPLTHNLSDLVGLYVKGV